jgi:hypothetical protein
VAKGHLTRLSIEYVPTCTQSHCIYFVNAIRSISRDMIIVHTDRGYVWNSFFILNGSRLSVFNCRER